MKFLQIITSWSNAELGIIKAAVTCSGIAIGIYFYDSLQAFLPYFVLLFLAFGIWAGVLWLKKLKPNP